MALDTLNSTFQSQATVAGTKSLTGLSTGVGATNTDTKSHAYVKTQANNQPLGADECYFLLLSIAAGGYASINLQSLTDVANQTAVSLARIKGARIRLLGASEVAPDGSTQGTACSSVSVGAVAVPPPVQSALATSTTGGSIAAGTYYYVVTSTTAAGESVQSNEQSIVTTGTTSTNTITWTAVTGATGYKVYRSTASGVYGASSLVATIGSGSTVTASDTVASPSAGTPPTTNGATLPNPSTLGMKGSNPTMQLNSASVLHVADGSAAGFCTVAAGTANLYVLNNDATNVAKVLVSLVGCTT